MSVLSDGKRVSVINAPAGSDKTRVLAELARAWQQAGLCITLNYASNVAAASGFFAGIL
jgi:AAA domain